jgi:hypothetical protein
MFKILPKQKDKRSSLILTKTLSYTIATNNPYLLKKLNLTITKKKLVTKNLFNKINIIQYSIKNDLKNNKVFENKDVNDLTTILFTD